MEKVVRFVLSPLLRFDGFKHKLRFGVDVLLLVWGWVHFLALGKNSGPAQQAAIRLFCATQGKSNDLVSRAISFFRKPYSLPTEPEGLLGKFSKSDLQKIKKELDTEGFYVFEKRLPEELCDLLLNYALTKPGKTRRMDGDDPNRFTSHNEVYDRENPKAVRYDFGMREILNAKEFQQFFSDMSFISVAQEYLNCPPILDVIGLWWHTAFSSRPDSEAAQFFHFDMDRVKWLKFFVYLTDVTPDTGPHAFVKGSQRTGDIPKDLLKVGYQRLSDENVGRHYPAERIKEFCGPRGTVFAEDTRGLHKGNPVISGDRLVFQFQFSNSLFGGDYPKINISEVHSAALAENMRRYPRIYSEFI